MNIALRPLKEHSVINIYWFKLNIYFEQKDER
ncbi:hypothetical protein M2463_001704 [Parabacteroides sp. PH5-13]|nr:hypothetical protein [Parabacteroides sp. PH5-39]MDH6316039.1 hypothetical protein [Parabacteroides sp. PF5-13]MDH6319696.1 hypothetical protein [Parabacteroides sp. PH5-13]MDH6323427.1 hypothetical protein [Parabacteroides sp. PH5-8]MDH6361052.1 hypothetical protein [Parabacteroides sp. PH5-16]MDH6376719.1 hypothetical protein [Parabacteroides sp. PH5-33]